MSFVCNIKCETQKSREPNQKSESSCMRITEIVKIKIMMARSEQWKNK